MYMHLSKFKENSGIGESFLQGAGFTLAFWHFLFLKGLMRTPTLLWYAVGGINLYRKALSITRIYKL